MGNYFQTIVVSEATGPDAERLGNRILHWLIDVSVVSSTMTDCVLGRGLGYPPGAHDEFIEEVGERLGQPVQLVSGKF